MLIVTFANMTVHQQVTLLNDTILYVFTFFPNKSITCDDRDPLWTNDNTKESCQKTVRTKIIRQMAKN